MITRKQIRKKYGISAMILRYAEIKFGDPPGKHKLDKGRTSTIVYDEEMFDQWFKTHLKKEKAQC